MPLIVSQGRAIMHVVLDAVTAAIAAVTVRVPARDLSRAAEALSTRYRPAAAAVPDSADVQRAKPLTDAERAAYLLVRAPATYAAVSAVLRELADRCPQLDAHHLIDLGAGPGVGTWAALAHRPEIAHVTLIERDRGFIALGREILDASGLAAGRTLDWRVRDLRHDVGDTHDTDRRAARDAAPGAASVEADDAAGTSPAVRGAPVVQAGQAALLAQAPRIAPASPVAQAAPTAPAAQMPDERRADLVLMSYALGELPSDARDRAIDAAWRSTRGALLVIEPGTPRHFAYVLAARARLLQLGATIAAPCPHHDACPMAIAGDWCHAATRLARSRQHRHLKAGSLSYEDEKFSYLIATRAPSTPAAARIVRHPRFEKGRVTLTVCARDGLTTETIGRKAGDAYRAARKAHWGDAWPPPPGDTAVRDAD